MQPRSKYNASGDCPILDVSCLDVSCLDVGSDTDPLMTRTTAKCILFTVRYWHLADIFGRLAQCADGCSNVCL
jgi:hypothetical protein